MYKIRLRKFIGLLWLGVFILFYGFSENLDPRAEAPLKLKRQISSEKVEAYRKLQDFNYKSIDAPLSFWEKIQIWFSRTIANVLGTVFGHTYSVWIFFSIALILLAYILYRIFGLQDFGLFERKNKLIYHDFGNFNEENKGEDLDLLIAKAVKEENFSQAIRYWYFKILLFLDQSGEIHFVSGKSNQNYIQELRGKFHYNAFKTLTYFFDYSFYGGFEVSSRQFSEIQELFQKFLKNRAEG